jgi:hypothetical protein
VAVTLAVSATDCPNADGLGVLLSTVLVAAWFTVWLCVADVLPEKLASPEYTAVSECAPTASEDVLMLAVPAETGDVPSDVAPSKNSIEPPGSPAPGGFTATLALIVTDWPFTDGFGVLVTEVVVEA